MPQPDVPQRLREASSWQSCSHPGQREGSCTDAGDGYSLFAAGPPAFVSQTAWTRATFRVALAVPWHVGASPPNVLVAWNGDGWNVVPDTAVPANVILGQYRESPDFHSAVAAAKRMLAGGPVRRAGPAGRWT